MTLEEITRELWQAAEKSRVCRIRLRNEPEDRIVYPYGVCLNTRKKIVAVCWQASGLTGKNSLPGFRNFVLKEIEQLEVLDRHFLKQKDFNPDDTQYADWVFHI